MRTWPSDEVVAPGERVSVVLDLTPTGGAHVYAPGQDGYLPVAVTLDADPAYTAHPLDYPKAENFHFAPLDENVRVYSRPFRLVQELTVVAVAGDAGARRGGRRHADHQGHAAGPGAATTTVCFLPRRSRWSGP